MHHALRVAGLHPRGATWHRLLARVVLRHSAFCLPRCADAERHPAGESRMQVGDLRLKPLSVCLYYARAHTCCACFTPAGGANQVCIQQAKSMPTLKPVRNP
jgi:hypothetical protein